MATTRTILVLSALLGSAGCSVTSPALSDPADITNGPVIASYRLTAQDGNALPCCGVDSGGVRITVVGGALKFYGPANYTDTAYTPGGVMSKACVHAVPNGSLVNTFTYIVTLPDSTKYLLLPCDRGTYALTLIRQLEQTGGASIDSVMLSSGTFTATPDSVDLADRNQPGSFTASVSVPAIFVAAPTHQYRFDSDSSRASSATSELARVLHD